MPTPLQGYLGSLQGSGSSLQGSSPLSLQGNTQSVQGTIQPKTTTPKKIVYGNSAATSPVKQQYVDSLKAYKYADDPTVYGNYNGQSDYGFHSADEFTKAGGNFGSIETRQRPQVGTGTSTPVTDTATPSPQPSPLNTARSTYLASLTPDSSVSTAKQKYNDFVTNEKLGENALEGQGRGIPLGLIRGQQSKLRTQSELEASRLQGDIGIAQDTQTANQNKAKTALDFATADVTNNKPLELASGSTLVKYNPTTQKYEQIAQGTPKPESLPASAQEYEYAQKNGYKGTYEQYQTEDANRKRSITNINTGGSGLTPGQVNTTVNQIAGAFDNEPIVREYNTVASTLAALKNAGTSPTDDIQRIYAFAKIADPSSAVKEGEYKTIQDYSTALFKRIGINVARAFNEQGFLTESARNSMSTTLNNILQAKKNAYDNVSKEYQRQIDDAYSGKPRQLTNYSGSSSTGATAGADPLGIR